MVTITRITYRPSGGIHTTRPWVTVADIPHAVGLLNRMKGDYAESPDLTAVFRSNALRVVGVRPDGTKYPMTKYQIENEDNDQ